MRTTRGWYDGLGPELESLFPFKVLISTPELCESIRDFVPNLIGAPEKEKERERERERDEFKYSKERFV